MKRVAGFFAIGLVAMMCIFVLSGCSQKAQPQKVRVLIIPKFEIGTMEDAAIGEAQLDRKSVV